jgi:hypothetical protein
MDRSFPGARPGCDFMMEDASILMKRKPDQSCWLLLLSQNFMILRKSAKRWFRKKLQMQGNEN